LWKEVREGSEYVTDKNCVGRENASNTAMHEFIRKIVIEDSRKM